MPQKLEQSQSMEQVLQQSTLQIAVANLVELPITMLAERVRDEMIDNAALEEVDKDDFPAPDNDERSDADDDFDNDDNKETDERSDADEDFSDTDERSGSTDGDDFGDYLSEDDIPAYLRERAEAQDNTTEMQWADSSSFYDDLQQQVGEYDLTDHEKKVLEYLIGSLDEDGFLRKDLTFIEDELLLYHQTQTSPEELKKLLHILQSFEPRGIGARSLQECLRLQLTAPERRTPYTAAALTVVDKYFKDFTSRKWDVLRDKLRVDEDFFDHVLHELTHLNPAPGRAFGDAAGSQAPTVIPDFFVHVTDDGTVKVSLNQGDVPELRVSPSFTESVKMFAQADKKKLSRSQLDAYVYAKGKVEAAKSFINLTSRCRETLLTVMRAIVKLQSPFFLHDDDETQLVPLTLREVSELTNLDISTVSRVTSSKYVQTDYGIYLLKFFFSSQFVSSQGEELSSRQVRAALKELIESEDKKHPLPDEVLTERLKEKGFHVARRTVAKYRDQLGLPTARLRRK